MRTYDAERLAKNLMIEHGLSNWTFAWNRGKRTLGLCYHNRKMITLSTFLVQHNTEHEVRMTMLHEIAHALVGKGHGHDYVWRSKCLSIGGDGKRCADEVEMPKGAWIGKCPKCNKEFDQHRAPLRVKSCLCAGGFNPERILIWRKNGQHVSFYDMPDRYRAELSNMRARYGNRLPAGV